MLIRIAHFDHVVSCINEMIVDIAVYLYVYSLGLQMSSIVPS